jgi:hypothetical protein
MRTYGRVHKPDGTKGPWQIVLTDANGMNDHVMLTTLAQVLRLNLGESPFYANYGIPARASVMAMIHPDYNVAFTQQAFADQFASLTISKRVIEDNSPIYDIYVLTKVGVKLNVAIPIPT